MEESERFHGKVTLCLWTVLLAACMCLMMGMASQKTIFISDTSHEQDVSKGEGTNPRRELQMQRQEAEEGVFRIPLKKGTEAESVVVENCYMDGELHVHVRNVKDGFYDSQALQGDISAIRAAYWEEQKNGVLLRVQMDGVYEYKSSIENGMLKIETCDPHDVYRMLVVIDPSGGGREQGAAVEDQTEKEITLRVAKALQDQWENKDVKLYFTRTEDVEVTRQQRLELIESLGADAFIRLSVSVDEDLEKYGIRADYNELYVIPVFGNTQLADILTRNVTIACANRALGLMPAKEESILQEVRIPAACIALGYLSNEKERELLSKEDYCKKLAQGIGKSVEEVYANYDE